MIQVQRVLLSARKVGGGWVAEQSLTGEQLIFILLFFLLLLGFWEGMPASPGP